MTTTTDKVAVVGLGYMGLPLAVAFGGRIGTIGFDINEKRVASIQRNVDPMREVSNAELKTDSSLTCTRKPEKLGNAQVIILAVPTHNDTAHQLDFGPGDALNSKMIMPACLVDVKSKQDLNALKKAGLAVWRL